MTTEDLNCDFCNERVGEGSINGMWVCDKCVHAAIDETFYNMTSKWRREEK